MHLRTTLFTLVLLVACVWPAHGEEKRLVILHTTDVHGALTAYDYLRAKPAARGLVKIASLVDTVRASGLPVLLLDAGDTIEGAGIETIHQYGGGSRPDPMMAAMTRMGYDAMAVGNHEFDFGPVALERARRQASFPWLAANVVRADGSPAFQPSMVKTVDGLRVGIVGLATPATPAMTDGENVPGLRFLSPVEAATREVQRLRASERCDVIVLLAHTGLEPDTSAADPPAAGTDGRASFDEHWGYRLLTRVAGVDAIVLGHSHDVITRLERGATVVAQAGRYGERLGRIDLTVQRDAVDRPWRVTRRQSRMIPVTDVTPDHAEIARLAEPYHDETQQALNAVLGRCTAPIEGTRFGDGPLWELIHRAQLDASKAEVSLAAMNNPAATLPPGPVTLRHVLRISPYDNTLVVVKLTGRELRDVLEHSAGMLATYRFEPDGDLLERGAAGFNFDAAEGVTYEIDVLRPRGQRLQHLQRGGRPIADAETLTVAVNSYRANGGGGYPWLARAPRVWRSDRPVHALIADYIKRQGTLSGGFTRSWRLTPDFVATPERALIERLVTAGAVPREELAATRSDAVALRGDLAYWIARAFGWREHRASMAFADVPDSLAPWLDGLLRRKVLGDAGTFDRLRPFEPIRLSTALDWCESAARHAGYPLLTTPDPAFRRGLLHQISGLGEGRPMGPMPDTLTRSQALGLVANLRYPQIRILETTDFHGAILGGGRDRATDRRLGGSTVLAAWIERLRGENPEGTVLLDGGDCFQGTMISNLQFGRPVVEQMNALRYTAAAIGNHEFDWGADTLERRIRSMKFAALGANMVIRRNGRRPAWARADTVVKRRGVKIGVLGLCYRYTPSVTLSKYVEHLRFEDDSTTAAKLVPALSRRSDIVVGVGHISASSDSTRAARGGDLVRLASVRGVSAWFGGHSHNLVDDRVNGVPVMIAGSHGEAIAVCDLVVDPVGNRVVESTQRLVRTFADEVTPDSVMAARVARWNEAVAPIAGRKIGTNARPLRRNRGGESGIGNLVTDAMRAAAKVDVALQNSGGLRADLPEGDVTKGTIYEVMPFDNVIVTMGLTAAEIRQALEEALRSGRVTQVSGVRYSFDLDRPVMDRAITLTDSLGQPLDSTRVYRVALNDFMATGGDDYDVLSGGLDRTNTGILVRDALEAYIVGRYGGVLDYDRDGRIERIGRRPERATD